LSTQINYQPQGPTLKQFHESDKWARVVVGPLGSGKTRACLTEILIQIQGQTPDEHKVRRSRIAIIRNTYPDLLNTVVKDFREVVEAAGVGTFKSTSPPSWSASYALPDGTTVDAEVVFMSFDGQDDQKKARGLQLSGVYFNEMAELNKSNVDLLLSRVGRYPGKARVPNAKHFVLGDTNPADRDHWLASLIFDLKPEDYAFFLQPGAVIKDGTAWKVNEKAENIHNLPDRYYHLAMQAKAESWIRRNLASEWVHHSDGRPVHPDFNEVLHVREVTPDPRLPLTVGIDFGRTPAAAIGQKQDDGRWCIFEELVTENMGSLKFGELLKSTINGNDLYNNLSAEYIGDPAGTQQAQTRDETCFQMLREAGIDAVPAPSNIFEQRTTALDYLLTKLVGGEPAMQIHPRCKTLIKGLSGDYQFRRLRVAGDERYQDKPLKNSVSHVCEALHYGLLGAGVGPLAESRKKRNAARALVTERIRREHKTRAYQARYE
jgi:hypothetical protein